MRWMRSRSGARNIHWHGRESSASFPEPSEDQWQSVTEDVLPRWLAAGSLACLCGMAYERLHAAHEVQRLLVVSWNSGRPDGWALCPEDADQSAVQAWYDSQHPRPISPVNPAGGRLVWTDSRPDLLDEPLAKCGFSTSALIMTSHQVAYMVYWAQSGGDSVCEGPLWRSFELALANQAQMECLRELSHLDTLTGTFNRRYFNLRLLEETARAQRFRRPLVLIIADLDRFKPFNDTEGHQAGDVVLRYVGQAVRRSVRSIDILCRIGGDEFAVLMPDTDAAECTLLGHRLCRAVSGHQFALAWRRGAAAGALNLQLSLGGAVFPDHADRAERLLWCADMALLEAKRRGGSQFVFHEPTMTTLGKSDLSQNASGVGSADC